MSIARMSIRSKVTLMIAAVVLLGVLIYIVNNHFTFKQDLYAGEAIKAESILVSGVAAMHRGLLAQEDRSASLLSLRRLAVDMQAATSAQDRKRIVEGSEYFQSIPLRAGLSVARESARSGGYTVQLKQIGARSKDEEAEGLAREFLVQSRQSGEAFHFDIDWDKGEVNAVYSIKVEPGHLRDHGRIEDDNDGNGYDDTGYKMEGWQVGEYHAAYVLTKDISQQISSAFTALLISNAIIMLGLMLFSIGLGYLVSVILNKSLSEPIAIADAVAAGNLGRSIDVNVRDETRALRVAMHSMVGKLTSLIRDISDSTSQQASASVELASISEEAYRNSLDQQSNTDQVATAINEMNATVHEVSQNAAEAAHAVQRASEEVSNGSAQVSRTISEIQGLEAGIEESAARVGEVEGGVGNIVTILDVIKRIAEQTNLLALNAAIEAARAGEQGRGFAVVADEVRTLAQSTQQSTSEIEGMIESLQTTTQSAAESMQQGQKRAELVVEQARSAGEALQKISSAMDNIDQMATLIATATEQQSAVTEEVNKNIHNISALAESNGQGVSQVKSASEELAKLASEVQASLSAFDIQSPARE